MRTRSSRAPSSGVVVRAAGMGAGRSWNWRRRCNGAGATTGEGARAAAAAAITSPFSTWPRLPLPATEARSILSSAAILAAAGAGGIAVAARARRGLGRRSLSCAPAGAAALRPRAGRAARRSRPSDRSRRRSRSNPRARRVDLERHLVGLELHQRLVGLHGLAGLLEPFADSCFADRLAERRDTNFSRHFKSRREAPFSIPRELRK